MLDSLLQWVVSNLIIASAIALVAALAQRYGRSASLTNLLWAFVLLKLMTPPLVTLPVWSPSQNTNGAPVTIDPGAAQNEKSQTPVWAPKSGRTNPKRMVDGGQIVKESPFATASTNATGGYNHKHLLFGLWCAGSLFIGFISIRRVLQFHHQLIANSTEGDKWNGTARRAAEQMRLHRCPEIWTTTAQVTPLVWWRRGRPIVVLPTTAVETLSDSALELVLAHEFAHVKRGDHWFRWLEWAAIVAFWWNPLLWIAVRQLRQSEELACDELVIQSTTKRKTYAKSLLDVAELLATAEPRLPAVASSFHRGGLLEKRLRMIIAGKTQFLSTRLRAAVFGIAVVLLPLGFGYAQDFEAIERRLGLAVHEGEITLEQANIMMEALRNSAHDRHHEEAHHEEIHHEEMEERKRHFMKVQEKIKHAVKMGDLSELDAERELAAVREELFGNWNREHNKDEHEEMEERKRHFMEIQEQIKHAVEEGELSEEDAERKLDAVREELFFGNWNREHDKDEHEEMEERKRHFMEIKEQIKHAVEEGELSEEDAERKLDAVREELFGNWNREHDNDEHEEMEERKRHFMEIKEQIKQAVKEGELSEEDAERKLDAVREELFGNWNREHDKSR